MKTKIYHLETGKPHECEPVDARELIASGAYASALPPEANPSPSAADEANGAQLEAARKAAEAPKMTKKQAAELEAARKAAEALGGTPAAAA